MSETNKDIDLEQGNAPTPDHEDGKKPRRHLIRNKWLRITLKTLMWLLLVLIALPILLYVPPVQTLSLIHI